MTSAWVQPPRVWLWRLLIDCPINPELTLRAGTKLHQADAAETDAVLDALITQIGIGPDPITFRVLRTPIGPLPFQCEVLAPVRPQPRR